MNASTVKTPLLNRDFILDNRDTFKLNRDSFNFPEKVIQFGTGVLLRGLAGYLIDKANQRNYFNGRVVVVKSTGSDIVEFTRQDNCYTVLEKGVKQGVNFEEKHLVTCISRVLTACHDWEAILQCAADPAIAIVLSNTTEAGLVFTKETIMDGVPHSFPAKLTAYLWRRYLTFNGEKGSGMVILPTELVSDNGHVLKEFVLQHAADNDLPEGFINWIKTCNHFCNTLVDRIVPGKSEKDDLIVWDNEVAFYDTLHTTAEPFLLWAIEGDGIIKKKLAFAQADERVVITENIAGFKEQKLRILNGSNTIVVSPACLAGCNTLYDTVTDKLFALYTSTLINDEIIPTIIGNCPNAPNFAKEVLDRFANPYVQYKLLNIALQCSSKMNSRNADTLIRYYRLYRQYPPLTLVGWASFFLFYTPAGQYEGQYYGECNGNRYFYRDGHTEFLCETLKGNLWDNSVAAEVAIFRILNNQKIFSSELASLPALAPTIAQFCLQLKQQGIRQTITHYLADKL